MKMILRKRKKKIQTKMIQIKKTRMTNSDRMISI
jgi:hypothetical protein